MIHFQTFQSKEEYVQTIERLDGLFVKYLYKGPNPFGSKHVKQTPHDPNIMWSSNQFYIVFKVNTLLHLQIFSKVTLNMPRFESTEINYGCSFTTSASPLVFVDPYHLLEYI